MHKITTIAILLLSAVAICQAQATYRLEPDSIMIGQQARLTIIRAEQYPSAEALTQNSIVAVSQEFDNESQTQTTVITCFEPGRHSLRLGNDDSLILSVSDVPDVDTASAQIRDIAPLQREPYTFWEIARWFLLALALVGVGLGSVWVRRKFPKKSFLSRPEPPQVPAHVRALAELEALRTRNLWQSGRCKEYYTLLTDIVRNYLEEACNIPSTDMTTDQTVSSYQTSPYSTPDDVQQLADMLQRADMVKFAKSEPLPDEHNLSMNEARAIIEHTAAIITAQQPEAKEAENHE
ncbi:MAG: hypothetical protein K5650_06385 [Bacteroidales bacterium]|nr:hypothetical protein [Bacteroidales bacterium]